MTTLHREIDALGGTGTGERHEGKAAFLNMLRSLFNIDGYLLPELTAEQQLAFVRGPVQYLIATDKEQSDAIFREVMKRQDTPVAPFSTYPEDRAKLLNLARKCELSDDANAVELGDLVRAILEDEAVTL